MFLDAKSRLRTYLRHGESWLPYWYRFLSGRIRGFKESRHRDFLLEKLPANSIGAEIGVHRGEFASHILEVVKPKKLHLIDPWEFQEEFGQSLFGGARGGWQEEYATSIRESLPKIQETDK